MQIRSAQSNVIITRQIRDILPSYNQSTAAHESRDIMPWWSPLPRPLLISCSRPGLDDWTLSPCMSFSKVQKERGWTRIVIIAKVTFFNGRFLKIIQIVFSYFIVISPWSHDLLFRLLYIDSISALVYGTVTWMSNQHYLFLRDLRPGSNVELYMSRT